MKESEGKPNLLTLKPELRSMILEELLITDDPLIAEGDLSTRATRNFIDLRLRNSTKPDWEPREMHTNVMATCHQLHVEAATVFYTKNTFGFWARDSAEEKAVKTVYDQLIRKALIHSQNWRCSISCGYLMLKRWPNVKELNVHLPWSSLQKLQGFLVETPDRATLVASLAQKLVNRCNTKNTGPISSDLRLQTLLEVDDRSMVRLFSTAPKDTTTEVKIKELLEVAREILAKAKEIQREFKNS